MPPGSSSPSGARRSRAARGGPRAGTRGRRRRGCPRRRRRRTGGRDRARDARLARRSTIAPSIQTFMAVLLRSRLGRVPAIRRAPLRACATRPRRAARSRAARASAPSARRREPRRRERLRADEARRRLAPRRRRKTARRRPRARGSTRRGSPRSRARARARPRARAPSGAQRVAGVKRVERGSSSGNASGASASASLPTAVACDRHASARRCGAARRKPAPSALSSTRSRRRARGQEDRLAERLRLGLEHRTRGGDQRVALAGRRGRARRARSPADSRPDAVPLDEAAPDERLPAAGAQWTSGSASARRESRRRRSGRAARAGGRAGRSLRPRPGGAHPSASSFPYLGTVMPIAERFCRARRCQASESLLSPTSLRVG